MKKIILLLVVFLSFSCEQKKEHETITIKKKYSVVLPSKFEKVNNLNEEASLQYQYLPEEFYVIVIDEPKTAFEAAMKSNGSGLNGNLEDYYNIVKTNFEGFLENLKIYDEKRTTINGNKAVVFSVSGEFQGMGIFYRYALIQGKSDFFQVMVWTEKARETKLKPNMDSIIQSFRTL
jgi:hypothetical protein